MEVYKKKDEKFVKCYVEYGKIVEDGITEIGTFYNNSLEKGKRLFANEGDSEKGTFLNGVLHGKGTITYMDGGFEKGIFENGALVKGIRVEPDTNTNGTIDLKQTRFKKCTIFTGIFKENKNGYILLYKGKILHTDGRLEKGIFDNDKLVRGKIVYPDGKTQTI